MKIKQRVCIREYGFLTEGEGVDDNGVGVSKSAFKYLLGVIQDESLSNDYSPFLKLTSYRRRMAIKVQNYVGVLQTPCGTSIEVLPKLYQNDEASEESARYQLVRMLRCLRDSPFKQADNAEIRDTNMPLLEVYISQFLSLTNTLVKRGIRSDYIRQQTNARFLKGRLLVSQQIRKHSIHPERFAVEHDEYQINRPANRLIKLTIDTIKQASRNAKNQRLAQELSVVFEGVSASTDVSTDFKKVKLNRGMSYYTEVLDWCRLLLNDKGPTASFGRFNSLSLLYPMERIFEDYVANCLKRKIGDYFGAGAMLKTQSSKHALVSDHAGSKIFQLRPDLTVTIGEQAVCVMDTKWKLIDSVNRKNKYGISQADMYQLYAYGHKCLGEGDQKELMLIYPKTERFLEPLPVFKYEDGLALRVVPFDLDKGVLVV